MARRKCTQATGSDGKEKGRKGDRVTGWQGGADLSTRSPQPATRMIGEVSLERATFEVHDGAIYMHEGETYRVDRLDLEQHIASVTPVTVDFYTNADGDTEVEVLQVHGQRGGEMGRPMGLGILFRTTLSDKTLF